VKVFSLLLVFALQAAPARPQESGAVTGVIRLSDGKPAGRVRVFARPAAAGVLDENVLEAQAETDATGVYRLQVPPGQYYIATGFIASPTWYPGTSDVAAARAIAVTAGATITVNITATPTSAFSGNIQVQFVHSVTGSPIEGVRVTMGGTLDPAPVPGRPNQITVRRSIQTVNTFSDANGNVEFRTLAPGTYTVGGQFLGFLVPRAEAARVNPTQALHQIKIQMVPSATISGRVKGAARVWAGAIEYLDGHRKLVAKAVSEPNAQGEYRLAPLEPGAYYVAAERESAGPLGLTSTYYPGTATTVEAMPVVLRDKQNLAALEFDLGSPKTFSVSGRVENRAARIESFTLVRHDPGAINTPEPFTLANVSLTPQGGFQLRGVPPGSWDVFPGGTNVVVVDRDIQGVALNLDTPTTEVRGRVVLAGGGTIPSQVSVTLVPRDSTPRTPQTVKTNGGAFLFAGVPQGKYSLRLTDLPENYHAEGPALIEVGGGPVRPVDVVLSNGGSSFRGFFSVTLAYMNADQLRKVRVTLVPSGEQRSNHFLYQTLTIPRAGEPFTFSGVIPGDYKVFAWSNLSPGAEKSPEFLSQYEQFGAEVHVTAGRTDDVQVSLIP
jgi:hypothetical protein